MNIWFTSDTHFGHFNIMRYCNRPFSDVHEMDEAFIKNWNDRVKSSDMVYHLGDFAFCRDPRAVQERRDRLNGQIQLIWGNHDKGAVRQTRAFIWQGPYKEIKVGEQSIVLLHYAMRIWNKAHYGSWHLYGHSHNTLPDNPNSLSFDVGVDAQNYASISFEEVRERMSRKKFVPIDSHVGRKKAEDDKML